METFYQFIVLILIIIVCSAYLSSQCGNDLMEKFGFLFQGGALFDSLPIWENVAFRLLHQKRLPKKQAREIAIQKLQTVGLGEKTADLFPSELSGGMQKRASLARAIAANPEIIFFDEPTTGLHFQDIKLLLEVLQPVIVQLVVQLLNELVVVVVEQENQAQILH